MLLALQLLLDAPEPTTRPQGAVGFVAYPTTIEICAEVVGEVQVDVQVLADVTIRVEKKP